MRSHFHFAPAKLSPRTLRGVFCVAAALTALVLCLAMPIRAAEDAPATPIGRVQGSDVSINDAMLKSPSAPATVASGNVVIVHSGDARLQLFAGGEVSICGPAKFTVLDSGAGITLALDFGRVQFDLPPSVTLRVITPSIVATPIDIDRGSRNLTIGLDANDSLCVIAASGAVELEQQFSGERLIVPESGDFSLQSGQLIPVAETGQSCKCVGLPQAVPPEPSPYPPPETAIGIPPAAVPQNSAPQNSAAQPAVEPPVQVALLAPPSESHPVAAPEKQQTAQPPPEPNPVYKIILPPMVFSSATPTPPNVPTAETALLIREVRADPDWEFTGRVETPGFSQAMSSALGEGGANTQPANGASAEKKRGFWSTLKRLFVGDQTP